MRNHVLVLTTSAAILACGVAASAQAPGAQSPATQQSPTIQPTPGGPMMQQQDQTIRERLREQLQERAQRGEEEDSDQDGYRYRGGMMGGGMMGRGIMGRGYGYHDSDRGVMRPGMWGPPMMMRMIFSLMDADGDGNSHCRSFRRLTSVSSRRWMPTKMASLPWKKCRISSAAPADRLPSSSLASRIQNKDPGGHQRGASLAASQWGTTGGPANDAGGCPRGMSAIGT